MRIDIRKANEKEIQILLELWKEKCRWLESRGKKLWNVDQFTVESLKEKYESPVYYICYKENSIVGAFILIEYDEKYWPEKKHEKAYYLHKLMVCNGHNGNGYAKKIIDWVKDFGQRMGKEYIRLDYDPGRPEIERLYCENEFRFMENSRDEKGKLMVKAEFEIERKS